MNTGPRRRRVVTLVALLATTALTTPPLVASTTTAQAAIAGDGPTRPVLVRGSTWYWHDQLGSGPAAMSFTFGNGAGYPVTGDWNGDGITSPGLVRGSKWLLRNNRTSGSVDYSFTFGDARDVPIVGDWDGDGRTTVGVVRGNEFRLRNSNSSGGASNVFSFGRSSDIPIAGDWNGDGRTTIGVLRGNTWYLRNSNSSGPSQVKFQYGTRPYTPVVGDWDGNGTTTIGIVRGRHWYLRNSNSAGSPSAKFDFGRSCDLKLSSASALLRSRGGLALRSAYRGTEMSVLPTSRKVVALTFDAGANANAIPSILSTLRSTCVPATFFLTGAWIRNFAGKTATVGMNFPVANHSDTHPDLTMLSNSEVREQINRARGEIHNNTKYNPRPMFRFPFGARDSRTMGIVNDLGYTSIRWTVDTLGWKGTSGGQSKQSVVNRVLSALRPGEIVLMHVGSNPQDGSILDADALPTIISELKKRGYGFVTVEEFM